MARIMNCYNRRGFIKRLGLGALAASPLAGAALSCSSEAPGRRAPIIDSHAHLFPEGMDKVGRAETLIEQMDACQVDKAVILGIYPRVDNEFLAQQMRAHPERLIAFASVDPNDGIQALDLLDRCVQQHGLKGLKIHPDMQGFRADDVELLGPLMEKVEGFGIPVLLHSWAWHGEPEADSAPARILRLAQAFPQVDFIAAHCGGMRFMDFLPLSRWRELGKWNNLYLDLSNILYDIAGSPMAPLFRWTLEKVGLDRVLMGSDFPDFTLQDTMRWTRSLGFDRAGLQQVTGGNAARLLNLA